MDPSSKENPATTILVAKSLSSKPSKIPKLTKWFTRSKKEPKAAALQNESCFNKPSKITKSRLPEKLNSKADTKMESHKPDNDNSKKLSRWRRRKNSKIPVRVDPSKDVMKIKRPIKSIVTANIQSNSSDKSRSTSSEENKAHNEDSFNVFMKEIENESSDDLGMNWLAKLFSFGNDDSMSSEESHKGDETVIEPGPSKRVSSTTDETQTLQTKQGKYKLPRWFKKYKLKKSTASTKSIISTKSKTKKPIKRKTVKDNVSKAKHVKEKTTKKMSKKKSKIKKDYKASESKIKKRSKPIPVQQSVSGDLISDIISMISRNKLEKSGKKASKYGITKRMRPFSKSSQQASVVDMKSTLLNKWSKLKSADREEEPRRKRSLIQMIKKTGSDRRLVKELISQIENDTEEKRNVELMDLQPNLKTNSLSNNMESEESVMLISNPNRDDDSADSRLSEHHKRSNAVPNVSFENPDKKQLLRVIKTIIDEEDYNEEDAKAQRQKKINEDLMRLAKMVAKKSERNVKESDDSVEILSKYYETPTTSAAEDDTNDGRTITINANTKSHFNSDPTNDENAPQLNKLRKLRMLKNIKNTGDIPYTDSHTSIISQRLSETYIAGPTSNKTNDTFSFDSGTDSSEYDKVQRSDLPRRSMAKKYQPARDDSDASSIPSRELLQRRPSDSSISGVRHRRTRLEPKLAVIAEEPPCRSDAIRSTSQRRRRRPGVKLVKGNSLPHRPMIKKVKKAEDSRYDERVPKRDRKFSREDMGYDDRDRLETTRFRPRRDDIQPSPPSRQETRPPRQEPRPMNQSKSESRRDVDPPRKREAVRESKRDVRPPRPEASRRDETPPRRDDLKSESRLRRDPPKDSKPDVKESRRDSKELKRDMAKEPATRDDYKESRHDEAETKYDTEARRDSVISSRISLKIKQKPCPSDICMIDSDYGCVEFVNRLKKHSIYRHHKFVYNSFCAKFFRRICRFVCYFTNCWMLTYIFERLAKCFEGKEPKEAAKANNNNIKSK